MVDGLRMDVFAKLTDACQSRLFLKLLLPATVFGGSYGVNFVINIIISLCLCVIVCWGVVV